MSSSSSSLSTSSSALTTSPSPSPTSNTSGSSSSPTITSANYFFGFVVTFVVLLLLFVGCGIGSWRRFRLVGTAWDARLQGVDDGPFGGRKRGRRKMVRPVFWETWIYPKLPTHSLSEGSSSSWEGVQPISAAFLWSRSREASGQRCKVESSSSPSSQTQSRTNFASSLLGLYTTLMSYIKFRRRPRSDHPPKPPPPVERPPPTAVRLAVMIRMPSPSSSTFSQPIGRKSSNDAGQSSMVGEYQIGVMQLPWPSNDAS